MRAISARAGELVRILQQSANLFERLTRRTLDPNILAELEQLADVNALPHLVGLALAAGAESRRRVASVAVATWRRVPSPSLLLLDESYRATWWTPAIDSAPWDRMRRADVAELARVGENAWALLAVVSFHARGQLRESAVRALDETATGNELPFLIVRLNDWVDVIADRARDGVTRRMAQPWVREWARNLSLVQRMAVAKRRDHREFVGEVYGVLRNLSDRDVLEALLTSDDQNARRAAFRLARESTTGTERVALVRRAMRERDPVIRLAALRDACETLDDASLAPIVDGAAEDAFMPIRRCALLASIERYPDLAASCGRFALLDSNRAVRELGRLTIAQREPTTSVAQFYRDQLGAARASELVPVLAGLGETGQASDLELIAPFAADVRPRVRREAIRALGRLGALAYGPTIVSALNDSSAKVVRAAREAIEENSSLVDHETVRRIIDQAPYVHSRIQAVRLATTLGKWSGLQLLLEAARTFDPEVGAEVQQQIMRWLATANARSTAPTAQQASSIHELLNAATPWVTDRTREWLRGFLTPWMRNPTRS